MGKVWIFQGGWDGHEPAADLRSALPAMLEKHGYQATIFDTLWIRWAIWTALMQLDLMVVLLDDGRPSDANTRAERRQGRGRGRGPGRLPRRHVRCLPRGHGVAVHDRRPVGLATRAATACDYTVNVCHGSSPIVEGLEDFQVCSEHYYLHVDPAIEVLATTRFPVVPYYHISNKPVDMPVAWTKFWGNGRVFYNSLGHHDDVFDKSPVGRRS